MHPGSASIGMNVAPCSSARMGRWWTSLFPYSRITKHHHAQRSYSGWGCDLRCFLGVSRSTSLQRDTWAGCSEVSHILWPFSHSLTFTSSPLKSWCWPCIELPRWIVAVNPPPLGWRDSVRLCLYVKDAHKSATAPSPAPSLTLSRIRLLHLHPFKTQHPHEAGVSSFEARSPIRPLLCPTLLCTLFHMISHVWWRCHKALVAGRAHGHTDAPVGHVHVDVAW